MEVRRDLDAVPRAAERGGEENRRPATPRRDVEDARVGAEPETPPEEEKLLFRRRVLDLVRRLRDDVVAGNHGSIIQMIDREFTAGPDEGHDAAPDRPRLRVNSRSII